MRRNAQRGGVLCTAFLMVSAASGAVSNDDFANALLLSGSRGVVTCFTVGATRELGEPTIPGKGGSGGASVWFRWTAPATGSFTFDTESSDFDTVLAVYTNATLSALALVGSNDNLDRNSTASLLTFNAVAGKTYQITVDGKAAAAGYLVLTWAPALATDPPPANDSFAAGQMLSGVNGATTAATVNATKEAGEPYHAGVPDGKTIWFRWIAPASGLACFDTVGSDFDTVIAAYQGSSVSNLTRAAANNDIDNLTRQSRFILQVNAGQEYSIAVGGVQMPSGRVREGTALLTWSLQAGVGNNDMFACAQALQGPYGMTFGDNRAATIEAGEPLREDNPGGQSIWYRWTAPVSGQVIFDTSGSLLEAPLAPFLLLSVYTGSSLANLLPVTDNYDPITPAYLSSVSFNAEEGTDYYLCVDGFYDYIACRCVAAGTIYLTWSQPSVVLLSAPRPAPMQTMQVDLWAATGRHCTLRSSTNLTDWSDHTNFTVSAPKTTLTLEARPAPRRQQFFRAVVVP